MAKIYFAFAYADSMLDSEQGFLLKRTPASVDEIKGLTNVESALNPSHEATVNALQQRYGVTNIQVPVKAPIIKLQKFDTLYLMTVRGLPRLEGTRQYTQEEIDKAEFTFAKYEVM